VNALFDGVVCPDFIREQWRERLIIDLDPSYPLDLTFDEDRLSADLSFGGYVTRCTFPYAGVYVVADRSTGRGIVLDQNMPESVKRARYSKAEAGGAEAKPGPRLRPLEAVEGEPDPEGVPGAAADATSVPPAADPPTADPAAAASAEPRPSDDAQVQKRRAAFRVIDGGN
jgi:stringent starvation protein B